MVVLKKRVASCANSSACHLRK